MPDSRNVYFSALLFFIEVSLVLQHVTIDISLYTAYIFLRFRLQFSENKKLPYFIAITAWLYWIYSSQKTPRFLLAQQTILNSRRKSTNTILEQKQRFYCAHQVLEEWGGQGRVSWPKTSGWLCFSHQHLQSLPSLAELLDMVGGSVAIDNSGSLVFSQPWRHLVASGFKLGCEESLE